jgi:2-dehydro-3-deoxyphosphooctonate aldolase (KDO 8-P synthase)
MMMAEKIKQITDKLNIGFIYKSSFDKANRSSANAERGLGLEKTMKIFEEIRKTFDCPIITDVHSEQNCRDVKDSVDILQIPAFLCRQTDLLKAAAEAGKIINIKKGQFLAPWDAANIVKKMDLFGNQNVMLTERGVSFGYNTLVSDMRSLPIMAKTGCPVVFDATHSVQQPGGLGGASGGQREFVETLASAAVAVGVAAIFAETHQDPDIEALARSGNARARRGRGGHRRVGDRAWRTGRRHARTRGRPHRGLRQRKQLAHHLRERARGRVDGRMLRAHLLQERHRLAQHAHRSLHAGSAVDFGRRALSFEKRAHRLRDVGRHVEHVRRHVRILLQGLEHIAEDLPALGRRLAAAVAHDARLVAMGGSSKIEPIIVAPFATDYRRNSRG